MNYQNLIKQSFNIVWKNKFLWIFGIFASGSIASTISYILPRNSKELNFTSDATTICTKLFDFINNHPLAALIVLVVFIILICTIFILKIIFTNAIVIAAKKLYNGQSYGFGMGFSDGLKYFWRAAGLLIVISLIYLLITSIVVFPILAYIHYKTAFWFVVMALSMMIYVIVFVLISMYLAYCHKALILDDLTISEAIKKSFNFFTVNWKNILLLMLITFGFSIIFATLVSIFSIGYVFIAIFGALGTSILGKTAILVSLIITFLIYIIAVIILCGFYNSLVSVMWSLSYIKLSQINKA